MKGRPFFDTNVLIYATIADDPGATAAWALLESGGLSACSS
jgi:predicted nucleic acid-binding protein